MTLWPSPASRRSYIILITDSPGKIDAKEDPCWKGYHMVGTKKKAGREVPNCVPGKKGATNEDAATMAVKVQRSGANETPVMA